MPARLAAGPTLEPASFKLLERPLIVRALLGDPEVLSAARTYQEQARLTQAEAMARVSDFVHEIVPHFHPYLYERLAYRLARSVATALFRVRVGFVDEANLRRIPANATVVFVVNHRSNMDYVLVAFLAAEHAAVSYAVGEWARVWPLDSLLRALGAFFIRRNSQDRLYRKVLERYVQMATESGVTQGVFPEGGLSRDGRFRKPKAGLVYYMLKAFDRERRLNARDLVFVPVAINYDRVLEDRTLLLDTEPEPPRVSKARAVWTAVRWAAKNLALFVRGRFHRFGYACVNFGTPLSVAAFVRERGISPREQVDAGRYAEAEAIVGLLMEEIAQIIPVTPVSLVASALLSFEGERASKPALVERVRECIEELDAAGARVYLPREDAGYFVDVGLRMLTLRRLVRVRDGCCTVARDEAHVVRYYANAIAHFFEDRRQPPGPGAAVALAPGPKAGRAVVLVHGLARTSRSMQRLAAALAAEGYEVHNWDYPSRRYGIARLVEALADYAQRVSASAAQVDFVTHSMGGLLVRGALSRRPIPNAGRVVMLAPPNRGAGIAARFREYAWARSVYGPALDELSPDGGKNVALELGVPPCPFGVVAGTRGFHPLQPTSYYSSVVRGSGVHDGTVLVEETRLPGMSDFTTVRSNHMFIMEHPAAIRQVIRFLRTGQFERDPISPPPVPADR